MRKVRVAQLGITHEHASGKIEVACRRTDHFELVGVVDDSDSNAPRQNSVVSRKPYEDVRWMTEDELLSSSGIDAVFVEKTNDDLPEAARRCAERGLHTAITDAGGIPHRRVIVRGTKGTFELYPTEPIPHSKPMNVRFSFAEPNSEYAAGTHNIELPPMNTRYDDQLIEFARCVRGEIENPYPYEHELLVQEVLLAAVGYTSWR